METSRVVTIFLLVATYSIGELCIVNDMEFIRLIVGVKISEEGCITPDCFKVVRRFHRLKYLLKICLGTSFSTKTT